MLLMRTKTIIPPARPKRVERARLIERFNDGVLRALTVVAAPAGFGKTTLAAEWARGNRMPVAWLTLEPADRSPERFLSYLIQAFQPIQAHIGQTALALLRGGQAVADEAVLLALINDLSDISGDYALAFDDYHLVDCPEIAAIVQFLLDHRPAGLHVILTSRVAPALQLARLRALDQVVEIAVEELRFTLRETREFLEQIVSAPLPPEELESLSKSTEGWAVGLQLAGMALARQPSDERAAAGPRLPAGQAHVFDYLACEVLRNEPVQIQDFLKTTALFDRFCEPLCETLLSANCEETAAMLAHIERANLFLIPLDASATWFRYHALFAEFLRKQIPAEQTGRLYRLASIWFEQNHLLDEAIHYAIHAADHDRAAGLLENHYRDLILRGEQSAIREWIATLPPEQLEARPHLWLALGWTNIIGLDAPSAIECAARAEALLPAGKAGDYARGEAKALRILGKIFGGQPTAADEISAAFILLSEQDTFLHSLLHFNLGLHHVMGGQTARAVEAFTETLRLTSALSLPLVTIIAHVQLGETRQMRGALGLAERGFQQVIKYVRETLGERTFLLGMPYISYAELLREQNRFDEAIHYAEQGIAYCHTWQPVASMDGHLTLARLFAAQKRWDEAHSHLENAMSEAETSISVLDDAFIALQMTRLALAQGDLPSAEQIVSAYELEKVGEKSYYHLWELTQLALLRVKVAGLAVAPGLASPLIEALSSLVDEAERRERVTSVIEALILRSYVLHTAGNHPAAAESISRALTIGAQGGYVRSFADEGRPLLHLLEQYRPQLHAPHTYLDQILAILRRETQLPSPQPSNLQPATCNLNLTRRELDILSLLAAGKSNQEIAAECVLTLNTVKKHVANILSKLGVANRTQAVMLAKKSGWIE